MGTLFQKHPALWRVMIGLTAGVVLQLLPYVLVTIPVVGYHISIFLMLPVLGAHSLFMFVRSTESFEAVLIATLFYPVLLAAVGFLSAEKQTKTVVRVEIILAILVVSLWVFGGYIFF